MAKSTKLAAALALAGAMLLPASASLAQQYLAQPSVSVIVVDCYYDISGQCGYGGYGGYAGNGGYGAYAAVGPIPVPLGSSYAAWGAGSLYPGQFAWGRLSSQDLVAIHGNAR